MIRTETRKLDDAISRLLFISDIHAHTGPLERFDQIRANQTGQNLVICNGDLVYAGPSPAEVVEWVRRTAGSLVTLGNHDEAMLTSSDGEPRLPPYTESGAWQRLRKDQRSFMSTRPHRLELSWRERRIIVMHGHLDREGRPFPWITTPHHVAAGFAEEGADLCVTSHTHFPFVQKLGRTTVANTGSLYAVYLAVRSRGGLHLQSGEPHLKLDADRRSSFLSITQANGDLHVDVVRFDYDRVGALRAMKDAAFPDLSAYRRVLLEGIVDE